MKIFIITLAFFLYLEVQAKDFGKYGDTYVIEEADMLEGISNKLEYYKESGKLEKFNKRYREEVKRQIKRPNRVVGIVNATESKTRKFDPTTELEEDIFIPEDMGYEVSGSKVSAINTDSEEKEGREESEKKETKYKVLYKAGTKINPLDYMLFNEPLVFIDGDDERQREFAHQYYDNNQLAKIILINGEGGIKEVGEKKYYYYFDQWGAYSSRFNIVYVPSIVYQKEGEKVLTIDEVSSIQVSSLRARVE